MGNIIKPEDKLSESHLNRLDLRYEDILILYAVLGKMKGDGAYTLWSGAKEILSEITSSAHVYKVYNAVIRTKDVSQVIQYNSYSDYWGEELIPTESPQQKKLRELEETIKSAQKQIEELNEGLL